MSHSVKCALIVNVALEKTHSLRGKENVDACVVVKYNLLPLNTGSMIRKILLGLAQLVQNVLNLSGERLLVKAVSERVHKMRGDGLWEKRLTANKYVLLVKSMTALQVDVMMSLCVLRVGTL